jgi:hypothetical protein
VFTDPTSHGTSASHADAGTALSSYIKYSKTTTAVVLTQDTGTATQQASGSYTALKIAAVETSLGGTANKLIDCYAGAAGTTPMFSVGNQGTVTNAGGRILAVNPQSGNYKLLKSDRIVQFSASATVTLDSTLATGTFYTIKIVGNAVTLVLTPTSGNIEGAATMTMISTTAPYPSVDVYFDGTNWWVC